MTIAAGPHAVRGTIITTDQVADAIGWDTRRARRWLQKSGAGVKVGGRVITTPQRLAQHFPDLWSEIALDVGDSRCL